MLLCVQVSSDISEGVGEVLHEQIPEDSSQDGSRKLLTVMHDAKESGFENHPLPQWLKSIGEHLCLFTFREWFFPW